MSVFVRVQDRNGSPPALALEAEDNLSEVGGHNILAWGGGRQRVMLPGLTPLDPTELPAGEPHPPLNPLNSRPCATARPEEAHHADAAAAVSWHFRAGKQRPKRHS